MARNRLPYLTISVFECEGETKREVEIKGVFEFTDIDAFEREFNGVFESLIHDFKINKAQTERILAERERGLTHGLPRDTEGVDRRG